MNRSNNIVRTMKNSQNKERSTPNTFLGVLSSVSRNGKRANIKTFHSGEFRDLSIMSPYGISSYPMTGVTTQVIVNDNNNNTMVGVNDTNRPEVSYGEVMLYSAGNSTIYIKRDGSIEIHNNNGMDINMDGNGNIFIGKYGVSISINNDNSIKVSGGDPSIPNCNSSIEIKPNGDIDINGNVVNITSTIINYITKVTE